ncbi:hypothetical protein PsorP6_018535 [Peronosclerospora sorghi]|nr:hypothetical protein PsorP6_018535 [Peronosclerospora sorghi]
MNLSHWPLQEEFLADKDGATCLSWNKSRFDVPMIMVGGNSDAAKAWGYNNSYRKWQVVAELVGHTDAIHDVCWAPNMGHIGQSLKSLSKWSKSRQAYIQISTTSEANPRKSNRLCFYVMCKLSWERLLIEMLRKVLHTIIAQVEAAVVKIERADTYCASKFSGKSVISKTARNTY